MGSASSRIAPRPASRHPERRRRRGIGSFLCGSASSFDAEAEYSATSSSATPSIDYNASAKHMFRARLDGSIGADNLQTLGKDPSLNFPAEKEASSCIAEDTRFLDTMQRNNIPETSTRLRIADCFPTNVNTHQSRSVRTSHLPSNSAEPNLLALSSMSSSLALSLDVDDLVTEHGSIAAPMRVSSSTPQFEDLGNLDEIAGAPNLTAPTEPRDAGELPADFSSVPASLPSGFEARRNSRRLFWDAVSRRISRINVGSSEALLSTESTASQDRWLFDFDRQMLGDDLEDDSTSSRHLRRRRLGLSGITRSSRSEEIRERIQPGFQDNYEEATYCQSGLHLEGTCSCNGLVVAEVSNSSASFARIVMLAEALFEVLDEIHRQPGALGLSSVSLPAKDFIVDSLPMRVYKMPDIEERTDYDHQCHICLAGYEEGESIRILPCRHEYHMFCVDKWLKEVHGVCPLCRGNVSEGTIEGPESIL